MATALAAQLRPHFGPLRYQFRPIRSSCRARFLDPQPFTSARQQCSHATSATRLNASKVAPPPAGCSCSCLALRESLVLAPDGLLAHLALVLTASPPRASRRCTRLPYPAKTLPSTPSRRRRAAPSPPRRRARRMAPPSPSSTSSTPRRRLRRPTRFAAPAPAPSRLLLPPRARRTCLPIDAPRIRFVRSRGGWRRAREVLE